MTSYTRVFGDAAVSAARLGYSELELSENLVLVWPKEQSNAAPLSDLLDVTPISNGLSITLPDARQASTGASSLIRNLGSDTFTVNDGAGGVVTTIAAGAVKHIYLRDNSTVAGIWGVVLFGAASSALTAADVDGYGLRADDGMLVQTMPISNVSSAHSVGASDRARLFRSTGGAITVSLGAATALGADFFFAYRNDGSGDVTLDPNGTETIDGSATFALSPGEACFFACDGSSWCSVGFGQSPTFVWDSSVVANNGSDIVLSAAQYAKTHLRFDAGASAAEIDVTFPASFKIYFLDNASGYTLTLKAVGGSGTVTLGDSAQLIVLCDGQTPPNMKIAHTVLATTVASFPDGTAAAPSINFTGDANTGIYSPGTDLVGIAAGGTAVMIYSTTENESTVPIAVPGGGSGAQVLQADEVAGLFTAHLAASDPHPVYLTPAEADAAYQPLGVASPGKNLLINGAMRVSQRGSSANVQNGRTFVCDRWTHEVGNGNFTGGTLSKSTDSFDSETNYCLSASGVSFTGSNNHLFRTRLEALDTKSLSGEVTVSVWVYQTLKSSWDWYIALFKPSVADNFTSVSSVASPSSVTTAALQNTWTKITATFTVSAADVENGLEVRIGTTAATETASHSVRIGKAQLEVGGAATEFERRPYGLELALCQRYLPAYNAESGSNTPYGSSVQGSNTTRVWTTFQFPVATRTAPTGVSISSISHFIGVGQNTNMTLSAVNFQYASMLGAAIFFDGSGGTAQQRIDLVSQNASGQILFTGCEL